MPDDLSGLRDQLSRALAGGGGVAAHGGAGGGSGGGGVAIVQRSFWGVIPWSTWRDVRHVLTEPERIWWQIVSLPEDPPQELMPRPPEDGCASLLPEARVVLRRRGHKRP